MSRLRVGQRFTSKEHGGIVTIENSLPMDYWNHTKVIIKYNDKIFIVTEKFIRESFEEVK